MLIKILFLYAEDDNRLLITRRKQDKKPKNVKD